MKYFTRRAREYTHISDEMTDYFEYGSNVVDRTRQSKIASRQSKTGPRRVTKRGVRGRVKMGWGGWKGRSPSATPPDAF